MRKLTISLFAIVGGALLAAGCGGADTPSVARASRSSRRRATRRSDLGRLMRSSAWSVMFTTTNFVLMPINSSGCGVGCGHVDLTDRRGRMQHGRDGLQQRRRRQPDQRALRLVRDARRQPHARPSSCTTTTAARCAIRRTSRSRPPSRSRRRPATAACPRSPSRRPPPARP